LTEPIRYIFAYADVKYDDIRIEKESWPELKPTTPWGQIPILEFEGQTLAQSTAIMRYLARKFKLTGSSELDAARCDELIDALADLRAEWRKFFMAPDEEKKAELKKAFLEVHAPKYLGKFDNIVKSNPSGKLVGDSVTWTDLVVACSIEGLEKTVDPDLLKDYPNLKSLKDAVNDIPQIKAWREKRPETAM
jgi:glutathione S-transferase